MRQALDALENASYSLGEYWHERNKNGESAEMYKVIETIKTELAKPEPKPVAWLHINANGSIKDIYFDLIQALFVGINEIPLYAAPPARKPLSEDELRKCFKKTNIAEPLSEGWPGLERFARAIEKAHGIE